MRQSDGIRKAVSMGLLLCAALVLLVPGALAQNRREYSGTYRRVNNGWTYTLTLYNNGRATEHIRRNGPDRTHNGRWRLNSNQASVTLNGRTHYYRLRGGRNLERVNDSKIFYKKVSG